MASLVSEELSRSKNAPFQTRNNRIKMSLANQTFDNLTDPQLIDSQAESEKIVEKIHTFIVWSIFNLLLVPFGILCCYFSYKVNQFKLQNRYEMANKWSKHTFVLNIITTLLMFGLIITIAMLVYYTKQQNLSSQFNQTQTTGAYIPWQPGR